MASIYPSSTTTATSSANLLRISGMASGIDTDAVVKSMVSNYQAKIDKANASKQTVQWQQEGYREIIKGVKGLQDYFDPLSTKYMLSENAFNTNSVTNSDNAVVTATVSSSAKIGTYIVDVQQLAEQAKISGSSLNSMIEVATTDTSKWSGANLTLGSNVIKLDAITDTNLSGTTLDEVVANINKKISGNPALNGTVSASYVNDVTGSYIKFSSASPIEVTAKNSDNSVTIGHISSINSGITSTSKLSDLGISTDVKFSLSYDTTTNTTPINITTSSTSTIKDLMDQVNSATSGAVTMSLDDITGKISFQSKNNGSSSGITIKNNSANISNLGITISDSAVGITKTGKDAIVAITAPGQTTATTTTQSSNKFTVNGVTYNLVGVNAIDKTSSVVVTANSDTIVSNVKKFIEDYNTIISTINTKLTEAKDRDYAPLTDDQRTSMSDDQIKTWEAKAKVGILRKDDYLSSLMTQLRGTFYSPVYASYEKTDSSNGKVALSFGSYGTGSIGIDTSTDYLDGGKLVIKDETKLKNAIENNLDEFKKLFIGTSTSTLGTNEAYIGSKKYNEDGIFKKIDNIMKDYVASPGLGKDGTYTSAGYMNIFVNKQYDFSSTGSSGKNTLPDQVYNQVLNVSKFQAQLEAAQTRYYAKFTALEKAMNSLNSQQSSLSSMMGTSA